MENKNKSNKIVIILNKEEEPEMETKFEELVRKGMTKGIIPAACVAVLGLVIFFVMISFMK